MKKWKRGLAALLVSLLLASLLPAAALAEETADGEEPVIGEEAPDVELSEIGVRIGDDYIRAEEGTALLSLLPLTEKYYTLDLRGYLPDELKAVSLETIKTAEPRYGTTGGIDGDIAVWARWGYDTEDGKRVYKNDEFTVLGDKTTIDLSTADDGYSTQTLELIVGTADQLNMDNVRYIVEVVTDDAGALLDMSLSNAEDRSEVGIVSNYYWSVYSDDYYDETTNAYEEIEKSNVYRLSLDNDSWTGGDLYLGLHLNEAYSGLEAQVYEGCYESVEALSAAGAADITTSIWNADVMATGGYLGKYDSLKTTPDFTIVWSRNDKIVSVMPVAVYVYASWDYVSEHALYSLETTGANYRDRVVSYSGYEYDGNIGYSLYRMKNADYAADGTYRLPATLYHNGTSVQDYNSYVSKAVVGYYQSYADAAGVADVKDALFGNGYEGQFHNGVVITVFSKNEEVLDHIAVKTVPYVENPTPPTPPDSTLPPAPEPNSEDTYFRMESAYKKADGDYWSDQYDAYVMPYEHDSYYYNGYQTVLLMDGENPVAEGTSIYPRFSTGNKVTVHAGHTEVGETVSTDKQESGKTEQIFRNGQPIQYSAAAENTVSLKNYWVTFLTQQDEPTLFVNGVTNADKTHKDEDGTPIREVILDDAHDYHHDIFIANLGKTALDNLTVTLSDDAKNIQLDEYWTVNGTKSLSGFTTTEKRTNYGELSNVAKIRLLPVKDAEGNVVSGEISGTLTITGGDETVVVKLTGRSGRFVISTDKLKSGVKYVHYSSVIQTSNMYESDAVVFVPVEGTLPNGLTLRPSGEIYGVPTADGTWQIKVRATYTDSDGQEYTDEKEYDLTISNNTDANVWNATDTNYELLQAIVNEDNTVSGPNGPVTDATLIGGNSWQSAAQLFWTAGEYENFVVNEVKLDGRALTRGRDYTDESGSTKITIRNQTLRSRGNGTHTISVEFREGDKTNGILKRAAQNYTLNTLGTTASDNPSSDSSSRPAVKPTKPAVPQATKPTFTDVPESHTFYDDVEWAYDNGLMQGVTERLFVPTNAITQATVVTVLSRMADVDLSKYENDGSYQTIPAGMWYTSAAVWATQAGLLPNNTAFNSEGTITRADMAIMLVKYLASLGIDTSVPELVAFTDAGLMSQEANDAFQVLYHYGIFKGVGNLCMDPLGITTRGQFSALIHRMNALIEKYV